MHREVFWLEWLVVVGHGQSPFSATPSEPRQRRSRLCRLPREDRLAKPRALSSSISPVLRPRYRSCCGQAPSFLSGSASISQSVPLLVRNQRYSDSLYGNIARLAPFHFELIYRNSSSFRQALRGCLFAEPATSSGVRDQGEKPESLYLGLGSCRRCFTARRNLKRPGPCAPRYAPRAAEKSLRRPRGRRTVRMRERGHFAWKAAC